MIKNYETEYDYGPVVIVSIDFGNPLALDAIKNMILFYDSKANLTDDEFVELWLKELSIFVLTEGRIPNDSANYVDEGWTILNGAIGITAKNVSRARKPNLEDIGVNEL